MRLPLATLEIFTAIAEEGSLRAAAELLGLQPSTVSHQLRNLEERLGTALFIRTTRSVRLTEAGRVLLRGTAPAFQQISEAVESARTTGQVARGLLRLSLPELAYELVISRVLPNYRKAYPEIEVELSIRDALEDILEEGMHAGIRFGDIVAQDMVAIRVTDTLGLSVLGSPDYLERQGVPLVPDDLLRHDCVRYRFHSSGKLAPWRLDGPEGEAVVEVGGSLIVNSLPVALDAAVQGNGLIYLLHDYARDEIDRGRLVPVLQNFMPQMPGLFLYYPGEYRSMMPLRLLIGMLKEQKSTG
ncbi:LysR family transcriptional regulator [Kiloniella sp. b19]|uniref:LysR family transcriptional regulator n=1 Tax=Kiloniella sp. GXU_MW_B19 TaxID=3141326 RepID=UPI0031D19F50